MRANEMQRRNEPKSHAMSRHQRRLEPGRSAPWALTLESTGDVDIARRGGARHRSDRKVYRKQSMGELYESPVSFVSMIQSKTGSQYLPLQPGSRKGRNRNVARALRT